MTERHVLERLAAANLDAEIWWDSSPLVFPGWAAEQVAAAPPERRDTVRAQMARLFDPAAPARSLFRGVTTNPPLSLQALRSDPDRWAAVVRGLREAHPQADVETIAWETYAEVVRRGAEAVAPIWTATGGRQGYLSAQVDPRCAVDADRMLAQGLALAAVADNVMVKVPGTKAGYAVIEELTARGIATNNTLAFTVPQFLAAMTAVERGLARARSDGVSLHRWRSVISHMSARYGDLGDLAAQAQARALPLGEADVRHAEIAIFKRACQLARERGYPGRMLLCSVRLGPATGDDHATCWHLEHVAGAAVVYTCPPAFIADLARVGDRLRAFDPHAIDAPPPADVLARLRRLPYFTEAYEPDGLAPEAFERHGALVETVAQFSRAMRGVVDFVARSLAPPAAAG